MRTYARDNVNGNGNKNKNVNVSESVNDARGDNDMTAVHTTDNNNFLFFDDDKTYFDNYFTNGSIPTRNNLIRFFAEEIHRDDIARAQQEADRFLELNGDKYQWRGLKKHTMGELLERWIQKDDRLNDLWQRRKQQLTEDAPSDPSWSWRPEPQWQDASPITDDCGEELPFS